MDTAKYESSKKILVLKAQPTSLVAAETYLRGRGWTLFITTDVKEALLKLLDEKFTYVLMSADHPNKKISQLPELIKQKFSIEVISFAETPTIDSYNNLNASEADYKLDFPVTGPAVEHCITKLLRRLQNTRPQKASDRSSSNEKTSGEFGNVKIKDAHQTDSGAVFRKNTKDTEYQQRHFSQKKKRSDAIDSLIVRGTQASLVENLEILDGKVHHKVQTVTKSGCIIVESERFSGYIVAALGQDQTIEEPLLKNIKTRLFKYLKENGEEVNDNDTLNLKLKLVNFEPWALEYADFLRTSAHRGTEVAVAFFPRNPVHPPLEASHHQDMAKIRLMDLKGDREVEFDLFLHLASNDKYILYTPKGGVFYQKQMDRLKQQGVSYMHVQKCEADAVTKYHAQNYLNDLVEAFSESEFAPEKSI